MNEESSLDQLIQRIRENYLSITLGILVILIAASFLLAPQQGTEKENEPSLIDRLLTGNGEDKDIEKEGISEGIYIVKKGDHLWGIAESEYGSGYNWVDIADVNKLNNPDQIEIGQELMLPQVKPKASTTGELNDAQTAEITIKGDSYAVEAGDNLWSIAVRAYGDGYMWPQIAEANKVTNPNLIETGQKLKLPRK